MEKKWIRYWILLFCAGFLLTNVLKVDAQIKENLIRAADVRRTNQTLENDDKGPVGSLSRSIVESELLTLGNVWSVKECCGWSGTWIRRPNTNVFDAKWRHTNGSTAADVLELAGWDRSTNTVTIIRKSMNGYYKATYNPGNKSLTNGTTTWYTSGNTWSATIE